MDDYIVHGIKWSSLEIVDEMVRGIRGVGGHVDYCRGGGQGALLTEDETSVGVICPAVEHGRGFPS